MPRPDAHMVLYAILGLWMLTALWKILFPHRFEQVRRNPLVFYHAYRSRAHQFFSLEKVLVHLMFILWITAYIIFSVHIFRHSGISGVWTVAVGAYFLNLFVLWLFHWRKKVFSDIYFLQLSLVFYLSLWWSIVFFLVYFLPVPGIWSWRIISLALGIGLIYYCLQFFKIASSELGIKGIYIILYLCTLIILPLVVIFSYVI
ncbi:MAG: hypothetical protein GXO24_06375 [Chlorobi bacterium]|nr:hypothetical protein [Chlorobiota bacterium]